MTFEQNTNNFIDSMPKFINDMNDILPSYQIEGSTIQYSNYNNKINIEEENKSTYEDNGVAIVATSFSIGVM